MQSRNGQLIRKMWVFLAILVGLTASGLVLALPGIARGGPMSASAEPNLWAVSSEGWHTFLGSVPETGFSDNDEGYGITVDGDGYAYVVGKSIGDWGGAPVVTHSNNSDGFLAKVGSDGTLLAHTFIGGTEWDWAQAVTIDGNDNLFVVGTSKSGTWDTDPISGAHGGEDVFVATFDVDGTRNWYTFLGTNEREYGNGIAVDDDDNIYAAGFQEVHLYLAKLNGVGEFQWQRVITNTERDDLGQVQGVAVDQDGGVYLVGYSIGGWHGAGAPVRSYSGNEDAFVAKFDADDGSLLWHTFLGVELSDYGYGVAVDASETPPAVYVAGSSSGSWGDPMYPFSGTSDAFVAQLNGSTGELVWNTFMGSVNGSDEIRAVTFDGEGNLYVSGISRDGWGRPVIPHPEGGVGDAAFVAVLSSDGRFMGHTFVGGVSSSDKGYGVAVSDEGMVYVSGTSSKGPNPVAWNSTIWGDPERAFSGTQDAFVAGLGTSSVVRYWVYLPIVIKH